MCVLSVSRQRFVQLQLVFGRSSVEPGYCSRGRFPGVRLIRSLFFYSAYHLFHKVCIISTDTVLMIFSLSHCCRRGWGCSSVDRASDRHAADAGSISRCGIGTFLLESSFSADSLTVSVYPRAQSHALPSVRTLKIVLSMSEFC